MSTSKIGLNRMFAHIHRAPGDVRHRLWTLYWLVRMTHSPLGIAVELGTRGGDTARAMLSACVDLEDASLFSFDIENCSKSIDDPVLLERWRFERKDSVQAAKDWHRGYVDMVFVDTDHTLNTTRNEIAHWSQHVRIDGCMTFHDYWLHDLSRPDNQGRGVKLAVDEWSDARPFEWELETHDAGPDGDTGLAILWRRS